MKLKTDIINALIQRSTIQSTPDIEIDPTMLNLDKHSDISVYAEQDNASLYEWVQREPILKAIVEIYMTNIAPLGLNKAHYNLEGQNLDVHKTRIVHDILYNLNFDKLLLDIIIHLILYGEVGVLLLDMSDIEKFISLVNKKGFVAMQESFDLKDEILFERDLSYVKLMRDARNRTEAPLQKPLKLDIDKISYLKPVIIQKDKFKPIKLSHFVLGYLIYGNPYMEELSIRKPFDKNTEESIFNGIPNNETKTEPNKVLEDLLEYAKKNNIQIPNDLLEEVKKQITEIGTISFVPASVFEHFSLPLIYRRGLIAPMMSFITAIRTVRNSILSQVIKAQDILQVKVDVSNLTKANVGTYLQNVINQFKNRQFHVDDNIPITALPTLITPLVTLFIPTYNNNPSMDIQTTSIPFQQDIINVYETLLKDLSLQTGVSPSLISKDQQLDEQQYAQINFSFFNKIAIVQNAINKHLTNLLFKTLKFINPDLYAHYFGLLNISLHRPYNLILGQLDSDISTLQNLFTLIKEYPEAKNIMEYLFGAEVLDKLTEDTLMTKFAIAKDKYIEDLANQQSGGANALQGLT